MQERGRVELKRAKRFGAPVSVILCDLDRFKNINDRYGHEAGDAALVQAAQVLREALRESDALGRWGGEEFIAVLPASHRRRRRSKSPSACAPPSSARGSPDSAEGTTISLGVATRTQIADPAAAWDSWSRKPTSPCIEPSAKDAIASCPTP